MSQFIFTARNGIHIIDLQKTMQRLKIAYSSMKAIAEKNGKVLFIGTKKQARAALVEYANKCEMFYIAERWLGGLLTNFHTVSKSIERMKELKHMEETDEWDAETKKEILELKRELAKKEKVLSGIKDMTKIPDALFIIDPKREAIAVNEAKKLGIPIFAVVDTNCNPEEVDFPIPGNDDAIRAIALFLDVIARAINEGKMGEQAEKIDDDEDEEPIEKKGKIVDDDDDYDYEDGEDEEDFKLEKGSNKLEEKSQGDRKIEEDSTTTDKPEDSEEKDSISASE